MKIYQFECLDSTQNLAINIVKNGLNEIGQPYKIFTLNDLDSRNFCILSNKQTSGIGSRGNQWDSMPNALTFSFAYHIDLLPSDLCIESSSIFFGFIFKQCLEQLDSALWLKWPNDLYVGDSKIGGVLTHKVRDFLVCGIGINLYSESNSKYTTLGKEASEKIDFLNFLEAYFESVKKKCLWKQIFKLYKLEFRKNKPYFFHYNGERISMDKAVLNTDGSLSVDGVRIFSLR